MSSVFGIIAPHPPIMVHAVGGSRAETTRASLDALASAARTLATFDPDTIVVMSPHAPALSDAFAVDDSPGYSGSLAQFGDPAPYEWVGDPVLAHALIAELEARSLPAVARSSDARLRAGWLDHATIVPLSFIEPTHRKAIVIVSLSYLPYQAHRTVGEALRSAADKTGRRIAFLASGDMSHRLTRDAPAGYSPRAVDLDAAIRDHVAHGAFSDLMRIDPDLVDAGGECGLRSFIALGGYAGDDPVPTRVLAYEGPWGVGYMTALVGQDALDVAGDSPLQTPESGMKGGTAGEDRSEIVRYARSVIVSHVGGSSPPHAPTLNDAEYPECAGVFVSLHRGGSLRGCIGTILPTRPTLAEEVAANAVQASTADPRFPPISVAELDDLDISVDVLHAPEECAIEELDPKRYGVIVTKGWRRGLLMPDLEGVEDVGHRGCRSHCGRQDLDRRGDRGPTRRRDRLGRLHAGLPGYGHRHSQTAASGSAGAVPLHRPCRSRRTVLGCPVPAPRSRGHR